MKPELLHVTYDVEVTHNGIAWFAVSSNHFKERDALAEMDRWLKYPYGHSEESPKELRVVRATKEIIAAKKVIA